MRRPLVFEALGSMPLAAAVIGSGIMAELLAHAMFEMPLIQASLHLRTGPAHGSPKRLPPRV